MTEYSSLREKGSTVLFLIPFLPFDRRLFLKHETDQPNSFDVDIQAVADGEFDEYPDCNEAEGLPMSNGGESAYFPTAMFASRVYLSVVKKRQTKGIAPRRSEGFEIHAALVDGRVGKPKPTENSAKRANAGPTADVTAPHVITN